MLARSFKSAAELRLTEIEHDSLIKVLHMLERGEIEQKLFNMSSIGGRCGTPSCMLGWARIVSRDEELFDRCSGLGNSPDALRALFLYKDSHSWVEHFAKKNRNASGVETSAAALALSNYLTIGEPRWAEALA